MAFIATTNGAKVVVTYTNDYNAWSNIFWFTKPGFTDTDLQALADVVKASLVNHWVDNTLSTTYIQSVYAYDMRAIDGSVKLGAGGGGTGDITGEALPNNVSLVVTHYTGIRGRAFRGRTYLGGFGETQIANGEFASGLLTLANAAMAYLKTDAVGLGWTFGVHSAQLDGAQRNPQIVTPITSSSVRSLISGSQRKRNPRP